MKVRIARKILQHPVRQKRLRRKLEKRYPPYVREDGVYVHPSWAQYQLFQKAWVVIHRKAHKYGDKFRSL